MHGLLLLAALFVPTYAVWGAVQTLAGPGGADTLAEVVDVRRWFILLSNTAVVCGGAVLTAVVLGGCLGLLATRTDMPLRRLLSGAALFGACVPVCVSTVVFFALIPAYYLVKSAVACGLFYGLAYTPLAGLVVGTALRAADRELEEQALLDAESWTVVWRVALPQAAWGVVVAGTLIVLLVATDITIPDVLMVRTFAEEVYTQFAQQNRQTGPLLTGAPVLIVLALLLVVVQARYRLVGEQSLWQVGAQPRVFALGRWRRAAGWLCGLSLVLGLGAPIVLLVLRLQPLPGLGRAVLGVQGELWTSAGLALVSATLIVVPAAGLAWSVARGRWTRGVVCVAIVVLLAIPAPIVGITLITLLNRPGPTAWIYDSPLAVVAGHFVRFLPIGVLLLIPAVHRVPRELEQAARVDGCGWLREYWHIRIPAVAADAGVTWLVLLMLCFAELGATVLLAPPAWPTASVRFATLIHFGVYRDVAILALLAAAFIVVPWALLMHLIRRLRNAGAPGRSSALQGV